jgi:hypothetical protein
MSTTFVLRIKDSDGTYAVGAIDLESGTSLEVATEIVIAELDPGQRLERITNAATKESASLRSIARAPQGFGK